MAYLDSLQSGLKGMAEAAEAGRRELNAMVQPTVDSANDLESAAKELEKLLELPPGMSLKVQRVNQAIAQGQARLTSVVNIYTSAERAVSKADEQLVVLAAQADRVTSALNRIAGRISPSLANILPTFSLPKSAEAAVPAAPNLLCLAKRDGSENFYFNLDTVAFNTLIRTSQYTWAEQGRLGRRAARQLTGIGTDTLKLKGLVMPLLSRAGGKAVGVQRIENLRKLAEAGEPFMLSTSEKADLGTWCLTQIDETQTELLAGGMPRMQEFTLEFTRYGDDLQIV